MLVLCVTSITRADLHANAAVAVVVDGAHAVGAMPLDLPTLGAHFYTSNLHKWLCTPKGTAFLWVARSEQPGLTPLATSHGYGMVSCNSQRTWCLRCSTAQAGCGPCMWGVDRPAFVKKEGGGVVWIRST